MSGTASRSRWKVLSSRTTAVARGAAGLAEPSGAAARASEGQTAFDRLTGIFDEQVPGALLLR
jgi:hypothetical protein